MPFSRSGGAEMPASAGIPYVPAFLSQSADQRPRGEPAAESGGRNTPRERYRQTREILHTHLPMEPGQGRRSGIYCPGGRKYSHPGEAGGLFSPGSGRICAAAAGNKGFLSVCPIPEKRMRPGGVTAAGCRKFSAPGCPQQWYFQIRPGWPQCCSPAPYGRGFRRWRRR